MLFSLGQGAAFPSLAPSLLGGVSVWLGPFLGSIPPGRWCHGFSWGRPPWQCLYFDRRVLIWPCLHQCPPELGSLSVWRASWWILWYCNGLAGGLQFFSPAGVFRPRGPPGVPVVLGFGPVLCRLFDFLILSGFLRSLELLVLLGRFLLPSWLLHPLCLACSVGFRCSF